MIGEIYLKTKSICIPLAFISTSYLLKGKFRLLSLKIFHTQVISHISSQNQVMIGLQIYFRQLTHRLLRKAITLEFPLSKPASLEQIACLQEMQQLTTYHIFHIFSAGNGWFWQQNITQVKKSFITQSKLTIF